MGRMTQIAAADGERFGAYLAMPESGRGPGLVLVQKIFGVNATMRAHADLFAEEGYAVLVPDLFWRLEQGIELGYGEADVARGRALLERFDIGRGIEDIGACLTYLRTMPSGTGMAGVVGFCFGGRLAFLAAARLSPDAVVAFYGGGIEAHVDEAPAIRCPTILHFGAKDTLIPPEAVARVRAATDGNANVRIFTYADAGHGFYNHDRTAYHRPSAMMAHSRTITLLRQALGPNFDLEKLWERHLELEFATRDADETMRTMVAKPYVNHVPVMTGGTGYDDLLRFYRHHFISQMPKDTNMIPVSRTIGADRVVDEMIFRFTHDQEIDWMLPGIKPTGRKVEIPLIAIVNFRGGRLYHEHIYWDQASVLVQIGLLDPRGLPVAGRETAAKVLDETLPSNTLMARWRTSEP